MVNHDSVDEVINMSEAEVRLAYQVLKDCGMYPTAQLVYAFTLGRVQGMIDVFEDEDRKRAQ